MLTDWPVMNAAAGEHRKAINPATSSSEAALPMGMRSSCRCQPSPRPRTSMRAVSTVPGADRVDGDAVARDLHRQRLGQTLNAEVGHVVGRGAGAPALAGDGRQIDDAAPLLLDHDRHDSLAQEERAGQLDLEHLVPDGLVEIRQRHAIVAARIGGVVDEHVDTAERVHDGIHQGRDGVGSLTSPVQVRARRPVARTCSAVPSTSRHPAFFSSSG